MTTGRVVEELVDAIGSCLSGAKPGTVRILPVEGETATPGDIVLVRRDARIWESRNMGGVRVEMGLTGPVLQEDFFTGSRVAEEANEILSRYLGGLQPSWADAIKTLCLYIDDYFDDFYLDNVVAVRRDDDEIKERLKRFKFLVGVTVGGEIAEEMMDRVIIPMMMDFGALTVRNVMTEWLESRAKEITSEVEGVRQSTSEALDAGTLVQVLRKHEPEGIGVFYGGSGFRFAENVFQPQVTEVANGKLGERLEPFSRLLERTLDPGDVRSIAVALEEVAGGSMEGCCHDLILSEGDSKNQQRMDILYELTDKVTDILSGQIGGFEQVKAEVYNPIWGIVSDFGVATTVRALRAISNF
jgi:hypothetical protein